MTTRETIKQAMVSILVGACIAFLTTMLQGTLDWLRHVNVHDAAPVGGMAYYALRVFRKG